MPLFGAALLWLAAPLAGGDQDPVIEVPADDADMKAAIAQARRGLPVFFGHATAPSPGEGGFIVKYDLLPGAEAEFIWAEVIAHKGDETLARLANAPNDPRFTQGQQVRIRDREVIDWAYWREGMLQGGATMRVLIERMPPDQARAMLDRFGW